MAAPWWQTAVIYQIYPRSFADSDGDGIGDLEGIRSRLDHLVWLGVDAIWLSPFFRSPMADFGYDVSDHCDVDPIFGTLDDFDHLLADAHDRGIKMIIDWVPNHSSDQHPWFVESRASRDSAKRDWYVWRDPAPDGGPPNNWVASFTDEAAWTLDPVSGQYYLHLFLPEQPDLNWRHPEVVDAMHGVLRFWLDRGVDGFRADVVHGIGKDPELPDNPPDVAALPHSGLNDHPFTHELLRDLRRLLDGYPGDRMMVGEVYLLSTALVAKYYGVGDELHLSFNFPPLYTPWDAARWRHRIARVAEELDPIDAWPTWVLSNHDNQRHRTRYAADPAGPLPAARSEARARAAAVLLCTLRGTPFLYQGEELGLEDAVVAPGRVVDPGGRDGCRAPIPWEGAPDHGWAGAEPWLPWPPHAAELHAAAQRSDPASMASLYRRLLAARRASPALHLGSTAPLGTADGLLGYERVQGDDRRLVLVNFADSPATHRADGWSVEVASDGAGEGEPFSGSVAPEQAVVLRPR